MHDVFPATTVLSHLGLYRFQTLATVCGGAEGGSSLGVLIWCVLAHNHRSRRPLAGGYAFDVKCRGGIDEALCQQWIPSVSSLRSLVIPSPCPPRVIVPPCHSPPFSPFPPPCPPHPPTDTPSLPTCPAPGLTALATSTTTPLKMQTSLLSLRTAALQSIGLARTSVARLAGAGHIQVLSARTALQLPLLA